MTGWKRTRTRSSWLRLGCLLIIGGVCVTPTARILAAGQTHPCDQAVPTTVTITSGAPYRVGFCSANHPEALLGILDNVNYDLVPVVAKTATPNALGETYYESNVFIQVAKGQHSLVLRLYNRDASGQLQLGVASAPFGFTAVDDIPPAAAPKILGIVK